MRERERKSCVEGKGRRGGGDPRPLRASDPQTETCNRHIPITICLQMLAVLPNPASLHRVLDVDNPHFHSLSFFNSYNFPTSLIIIIYMIIAKDGG